MGIGERNVLGMVMRRLEGDLEHASWNELVNRIEQARWLLLGLMREGRDEDRISTIR